MSVFCSPVTSPVSLLSSAQVTVEAGTGTTRAHCSSGRLVDYYLIDLKKLSYLNFAHAGNKSLGLSFHSNSITSTGLVVCASWLFVTVDFESRNAHQSSLGTV